MRVCVLSHLYPNPAQPTRGLFVQQHIRALRAAGAEVSVISPVPWVPPGLAALRSRWRSLRSIPASHEAQEGTVLHPRFFTLPQARWRRREGTSMARSILPLLAGRSFDLLHAHTAVPDGDAARQLATRVGRPFVCTIHGYDALWLRSPGPVRTAILAVFREAARVICVSERVRTSCLEHDPRPDHFSVIHHGVDLPAEPRDPWLKLPTGRRVILSVGNLIPQKGFAELLEALAMVRTSCPSVHLVIVGSGPELLRLRRLRAALDLRDHVDFVGWQPHERLLALYPQADVFCLASRDEGFGVVYLEAMAHGIPVIGSRGEGIADIIVDGDNGLLVPACEPAPLASAITCLLGDRELRRRLGTAGRETVAGRLTWAENAARHLQLYRHVVGSESD